MRKWQRKEKVDVKRNLVLGRDSALSRSLLAGESAVLQLLLRLAARNMERNVSKQWQRQAADAKPEKGSVNV
jgi:hypothetical protein